MNAYSYPAPDVNCYNVSLIKIGVNTTISQRAYLCTASHNITNPQNPLISAPIIIENQVWIAAKAIIGMGLQLAKK